MSTQNYRRSKRNLDVNKKSNMSDDVISISSTEEPEEDVADSHYVKKSDHSSSGGSQSVKIKTEPGIEEAPNQNILQRIVPHMTPYAKYVYRVAGVYIFWILLHYVTAHLYVRYCASPTWYGFMISPFLISAPHCIAMRWVFSKGGTVIEGMWILVGTWLCSKIITQ